MGTCRSWRPRQFVIDMPAPPNRKAWGRCTNRVPKGEKRCGECWELLVTHPDPNIQRSLALEDDIPVRLRELLAMSGDPVIEERLRRTTVTETGE